MHKLFPLGNFTKLSSKWDALRNPGKKHDYHTLESSVKILVKTLYIAVFGGLKSRKKSLIFWNNTEKSRRAVSKANISDIVRDLEI